jgi:hypothetical protein
MPTDDRSRPIRVVIAYDMSIDADRAVGIVASVRWPPGSIVRIVTSSSGIGTGLSSFAAPRELRAYRAELHAAVAAPRGTSLRSLIVSSRTVCTPSHTCVPATRQSSWRQPSAIGRRISSSLGQPANR